MLAASLIEPSRIGSSLIEPSLIRRIFAFALDAEDLAAIAAVQVAAPPAGAHAFPRAARLTSGAPPIPVRAPLLSACAAPLPSLVPCVVCPLGRVARGLACLPTPLSSMRFPHPSTHNKHTSATQPPSLDSQPSKLFYFIPNPRLLRPFGLSLSPFSAQPPAPLPTPLGARGGGCPPSAVARLAQLAGGKGRGHLTGGGWGAGMRGPRRGGAGRQAKGRPVHAGEPGDEYRW
jgi:hypothetical protein